MAPRRPKFRTVAEIANDATKELEAVQEHQQAIIDDTAQQIVELQAMQADAVKERNAASKAIKRLLKLFGF